MGVAAKPHPGRPEKLEDRGVEMLAKMLLEGPRKHGTATDLWTLPRIAELIETAEDFERVIVRLLRTVRRRVPTVLGIRGAHRRAAPRPPARSPQRLRFDRPPPASLPLNPTEHVRGSTEKGRPANFLPITSGSSGELQLTSSGGSSDATADAPKAVNGASLGGVRGDRAVGYGYDPNSEGMGFQITAVPEIDPAGLGSVAAFMIGAVGLLERRRLKATTAA